MCSVCRIQPQQAALVPCGHSGYCYMCALTISAMQVSVSYDIRQKIA